MSNSDAETVREALRQVIDTETGKNVVDSGMISGLAVRDGKASFLITIALSDKDKKAYLREACETAVRKLPGISRVSAVLTAQSEPKPDSAAAKKPATWNITPLDHVKKIIAVASGKGGVGKSTAAVNLAAGFRALGKRAGVLDADIYGPSIPHMLGLKGQPEIKDGKMLPLESHGIACMSIGFITGDQAAILRGPMISKALQQLLRATRWGTREEPLDVLIVDMPPGTGDIHLSMAQQVPLAGAVIVTTPQAVARLDAKKCAVMFQKVQVPLLGVIENMSGELFGSGGGKALAEEVGAPFLGSVPAEAAIREAGDAGIPCLNPVFSEIARRLL